MPFDESGNFVPLGLPDYPALGGQPIFAAQFNNVIQDLMGGLASVLTRNGSSSLTGNLPAAGFKLTGLGEATSSPPGQALVFGQAGGQLADLTLTGSSGFTASAIKVATVGATEPKFTAGITSGTQVAFGFNFTGGLSSISSYNGRAFVGSAQSIALDVALGGAVRASFLPTGELIIPGTTSGEGMRITHNAGHLGIWNSAGATRSAYLQGLAGGDVILYADAASNRRVVLSNNVGTASLEANGTFTAPAGFIGPLSGLASNVPWTGVNGRPTKLSQFENDLPSSVGVTTFNTRSGTVFLNSVDVTGALGYTPVQNTSAAVKAALGYSPYSDSNPSGFIAGISYGMVTSALGFTPYSNTNPSGFTGPMTTSWVDHFTGTDAGRGRKIIDSWTEVAGNNMILHRQYEYIPMDTGGSGGGT